MINAHIPKFLQDKNRGAEIKTFKHMCILKSSMYNDQKAYAEASPKVLRGSYALYIHANLIKILKRQQQTYC